MQRDLNLNPKTHNCAERTDSLPKGL